MKPTIPSTDYAALAKKAADNSADLIARDAAVKAEKQAAAETHADLGVWLVGDDFLEMVRARLTLAKRPEDTSGITALVKRGVIAAGVISYKDIKSEVRKTLAPHLDASDKAVVSQFEPANPMAPNDAPDST